MRSRKHSQSAIMRRGLSSRESRATLTILFALLFVSCFPLVAFAHPLGNFTINHFARIEVGNDRIRLRYVIDMAEIPTFQELQAVTAKNEGWPSKAELDAWVERVVASYTSELLLMVDGARVPLKVISKSVNLLSGAGGVQTMRIECDLAGVVPASSREAARRLRFEDNNYHERIGWR